MNIKYYSNENDYFSIPGSPIAYWWNSSVLSCFNKKEMIPGNPMKGIQTGDCEKYLRLWYEPSICNLDLECNSYESLVISGIKWFPLTSGGVSRKWYGNYEMVANLKNGGSDIRSTGLTNHRLKDSKYYFLEGLTWTEVTTKPFSCRFLPSNVLFGNGGPVVFEMNEYIHYTIALLNSVVSKELFSVLAPTMNYGPDQVRNIPFLLDYFEQITALTKKNINESKMDWDSFETSWDFKKHPLL